MNFASAASMADAHARRDRSNPTEKPPSPAACAWPVAILGIPFDPVTIDGAIARIEGMIASRQPHYVVTANVDFLIQAQSDVELRRILIDADLVLCDGTPVVWASAWLGNRLPERVAGADLAPALLRVAAEKGHRVFFLGAAPGVAAEAAARLQTEHPTLKIVGHYAPPFAGLLEMDHAQIVQRVREARPDILLVSFGCPKQEKWIAMHHRTLGVPVAIGVGATLDFIAGRVKRAPAWMRRSGTEWLYRLAQEPRRLFRRYATDLVYFLPLLAAQWLNLGFWRRVRRAPGPLPSTPPDWCGIDAGGSLTREALQQHDVFWSGVPRGMAHCVVDVSHVRRIDGTGIAFLVHWRKTLRAHGRQLVLLAPSGPLQRALSSLRLTDHFAIAAHLSALGSPADALTTAPVTVQDGTSRSLAWCGEIVAANAEDVWRATTDHVRAFAGGGATLVVIDVARLRFIDSSGASLMLRLTKLAQELKVQLIFTRPHPNVRNVLRLAQLDALLLEGAQ
jgi:N-acetylglucosaminyldiphosphoundecaprenol N-acetyl-beta-D-mannosaminyltransferase